MQTKNIGTMQIGDCLHGFELTRRRQLPDVDTQLLEFRHRKTGAELIWSNRPEENKTFAIAFQTLPEDDTGVFHILEHSVLCGSQRYPVKDPFVVLLQSSMQTFLNAMTFSDKTVYPVSSRNDADFRNLVSVYLDAVFSPKIYENPNIFRQEGWHYEMPSKEQTPYCNGVVFNEMKGAFSDVDTLIEAELMRLLYPDNCYHYVSGGDPKHIPELTYEKFIQTHRRFYHPSNAKIFLDGQVQMDWLLEYLDREYLSNYDYRAPDFKLTVQKPLPAVTHTVCYEAAPDAGEASAHLALGKILCSWEDWEKTLAATVLCDYLTASNDAPLKRALLEKGLCQEVKLGLSDGIAQPYLCFHVENTTEANFPAIRQTLRQTISALCQEGIQREELAASLEREAFQYREREEPYGLILGLRSLDSWLYGGDPAQHLETGAVFDALRQKLNTPYFEDLLREMLLDDGHMAELRILPSKEKRQQEEQEEQKRLQQIYEGWSEAQREQTAALCRELNLWQQTPDSKEAGESLPRLALGDVEELPRQQPVTQAQLSGTPVLHIGGQTGGITYLELYFDLSGLDLQALQTLSFMTNLFGMLPTAQYTVRELQRQLKTWLGSFSCRVDVLSRQGETRQCRPLLVASCSMLQENVSKALQLTAEILLHTRFDVPEQIHEILLQEDHANHQALISSGHIFAVNRTLAGFSAESSLREALSGYTCLQWVHSLAEDYEARKDALCSQMAALQRQAVCRARLTVGCSGIENTGILAELIDQLPEGQGPAASAALPLSGKDVHKLEIPSGVSYGALGGNLYTFGREYSGQVLVLANLLSFSYLWNAVRVQGGAYGTGMSVRPSGDIFCYSYRDPSPVASLEVFRRAAEFVQSFCTPDRKLEDLIIGAVNSTEPLLSAVERCRLACTRYFRGIDYEKLCKIRSQLLHTTSESLLDFCDLLQTLAASGAVCVVGNQACLKEVK